LRTAADWLDHCPSRGSTRSNTGKGTRRIDP
jgi:hypothetical protein